MTALFLHTGVEDALAAEESFWAPFVERAADPAAATQEDADSAATDAMLAAYNILHDVGLDKGVALIVARTLCLHALRRAAAVAEIPLAFLEGGTFDLGGKASQ